MAIHIKCPNGHNLTAKESNAGKSGKCPVCKCPVIIPAVKQEVLTESAVLDILGDPEPRAASYSSMASSFASVPQKTNFGRSVASTTVLPTSKTCTNCERDIDIGYHICPYCHTYLTGLSEF